MKEFWEKGIPESIYEGWPREKFGGFLAEFFEEISKNLGAIPVKFSARVLLNILEESREKSLQEYWRNPEGVAGWSSRNNEFGIPEGISEGILEEISGKKIPGRSL